jgi:hypothetical protein
MTTTPTTLNRGLRLTGLALLLGAAAMLTLPAFAQDEATTTPPRLPGGIAFSAVDADGDGTISAEEWAAFVEARQAMTPEERRAARAQTMAERIVAELDGDGDGLLSTQELAGLPALMRDRMAATRTAHPHSGRPGMAGPARMGHDRMAPGRTGYDRMGSSVPERGAMRGDAARPGPDVARIFARIDTDGDGQISLAELETAMEQMRSLRGLQPGTPRGANR